MKYMIYEDAITHRFTFLPLPNRYADGDALPPVTIDRWFDSHAAAVAALAELFSREADEPEVRTDDAPPAGEIEIPLSRGDIRKRPS